MSAVRFQNRVIAFQFSWVSTWHKDSTNGRIRQQIMPKLTIRTAATLLLFTVARAFVPSAPTVGNFPPTIRSQESSLKFAAKSYDLVVVGGGVVGAVAALTAATSLKKNVALVDAPRESGQLIGSNGEDLSLGGPTGLFSKALRDTSKRIKVSTLRGMGLREDSVWNEIISSCVDLAGSNAQDILRQLDMAGIEYIQALASFPDSGGAKSLLLTKEDGSCQSINADKILIASGSKPYLPGGIPFDGKRVFDSDSINTISYLPKSIAITGSGIIAVEYAKIFRNLGAEVTLIIRDAVPRNALMKIGLDIDVAATLVSDLVRSGIKIERGAQVKEFELPDQVSGSNGIRPPIKIDLEAKGGGPRPTGTTRELKCDAYLAAVGRKPNTSMLNLAAASIDVDEYGGILVDSNLCTSAPTGNVYAAGDVVGRPFLASTGVAQAKAAVNAMFQDSNLAITVCEEGDPTCDIDGASQAGTSFDPASLSTNPFAFPTGVWSSPEAAYYGLTSNQAIERGIDAGEGIALYAECLRGRVFSPNGLLKLVFEKSSGKIIGGELGYPLPLSAQLCSCSSYMRR